MANTVDLRTYVALERSFVRRLQRSWRIQSAPTYAAITQACIDHKWDEARRLVLDLDMAEVGTENRQWIQYMLYSCGVFGANIISKRKPSFVGVGSFDTFLSQTTNNILQYLEYRATAQVHAEALQSIAEDEAKVKAAMLKVAWDERKHPRDKIGQFAPVEGRQPGEEEFDIEGAGPERKKWSDLNAQLIAAQDVYVAELTRHRDLVKSLSKRYNVDNILDYPEEGYAEYRASQAIRDAAAKEEERITLALKEQTPRMKIEVVSNIAVDEAKKMGVHPWYINVVDVEGREFSVGEKKFTEGGHFQPWDEMIEINVRNIPYGDAEGVRGLVSHELSHFIYHRVKAIGETEFAKFKAKALDPNDHDQYTPWHTERFEPDPNHLGSYRVRAAYEEQLAAEFPATASLSTMSGGYQYMFKGLSSKMIAENGHSAYAKSYWSKEALATKHSYEPAVNETLAELTRYINHPESWREAEKPSPMSPWLRLTKEMHLYYRERQARIEASMAKNKK